MKYHLFIILLTLACSPAFSGCSADTQEAGQEKTVSQPLQQDLIEPCELITKSDAETLLGEPVKDAEKSEQQVVGMKLCMYNPVDETSMSFLQITLTQQAFMNPGGVPPSDIFNSIKEAHSEGRIDLQGFGDEAFITTGGLYILIDEYYISIGAGNIDRQSIRERLKAAGQTAIKNLAKLQ